MEMDETSNQGQPCVIVISQQSVVTERDDTTPEVGLLRGSAVADCEANVIVHGESVTSDNEEPITLLQTQEQEHTYRRLMVVPDDVVSGRQSAMSDVRAASPNSMDAVSFTLPNCDNTMEFKEFSQSTLNRYYGDVTPYGTVAQRGCTPTQREIVDGNVDEGTIQNKTSTAGRYSGTESPDPTSKSSTSTSVYSTLIRTSRKGTQQVLLGARNMSYVDFIPSKIKKSCGRREYKNFSDCMDQANDWMKENNQQVNLLRCESLRHRLDHSHRVNPESTSSHDRSYVIGLRLWFYQSESPSGDCNNTAQKLVYQNFIPGYRQTDRTTGWKSTDSPFFENLQQTTKRLNEHLLHCPLSGNLLSIESVPVNYKTVFRQKGQLDVDASYCCIEFQGQWDFFFIRMFYLENLTQPCHRPINVKDFVPYPVTFPPSVIEFQTFSSLIAKANRWVESNQSADIITIQTIEIPFKTKLLELQKGHVKSNSMSYECPRYSVHWDTIRVLRIWFKEDPSRQQLQIPLQQSNYDVKPKMEVRTFFPEQLTMPGCCGTQKPIFATTHDTVQRIDQWATTTGAEIVDIETESFEKWSGKPRKVQNDLTEKCYNKEDFASTFTRSALDYRLTAFRVYYRPNALTSIEDPTPPSQPVKPCCCFVGCTIM